MRGYLWERLATEVIREFDQFGRGVDAEEIAAVGGYTVGTLAGFDMWARHEELALDRALGPELLAQLRGRRREVVHERRRQECASGRPLTPAERMRAVRARRAAEGKCVACERKREPGYVRCREHVAEQREIDSTYRAQKARKAAGMSPAA